MMDKKTIASFVNLILIASSLAVVNLLIIKFLLPAGVYETFQYSIVELYLIFTSISIIILAVLHLIKDKLSQQIGFVFLGLTSLKLVICYLLIAPVLEKTGPGVASEKINFFVIFILFLAIEVLFTSKLLNDKK